MTGCFFPYLGAIMNACALIFQLFFGLLFLFSEKAGCQVEPFGFRFQTYSTRHGLANNQVRSIAEDAGDFIRAAAHDGVS